MLSMNVKNHQSVFIGSNVKLTVLEVDNHSRHVRCRLIDTSYNIPRDVEFTLGVGKNTNLTRLCKVTVAGTARRKDGDYVSLNFDAPRSVEIVGSWRLPADV